MRQFLADRLPMLLEWRRRYNQDRLVKKCRLAVLPSCRRPSALEILVRDFRIMHRLTRTQNTIELKAVGNVVAKKQRLPW